MNTATEPETSSPPFHESTTTTLQTESLQPQKEIFEQLRTYPFTKDREFATGLAIILGHPETPASEGEIARNDDLVLQAKCYYFTRYAPYKVVGRGGPNPYIPLCMEVNIYIVYTDLALFLPGKRTLCRRWILRPSNLGLKKGQHPTIPWVNPKKPALSQYLMHHLLSIPIKYQTPPHKNQPIPLPLLI